MSEISIVIAALAGVVSVVAFFIARAKEKFRDGNEHGELFSDVKYVKRRVDDVLLESKDTNKRLDALTERLAKVEESAKSAHRRIDEWILRGKEG